MNDTLESFEAELRQHRPAAPPAEFLARLMAADPKTTSAPGRGLRRGESVPAAPSLWTILRWWLAPVAVAAIIGVMVVIRSQHPAAGPVSRESNAVAATPAVKADDVNIENELVNSFETVARLPSGEPVRYRCREWLEDVTLRDRAGSMIVEKRTPRFEVVPVRFETY